MISWNIGHIYCNQTWRKGHQEISYPKLALSPAYSEAVGEEFPHGEGLEPNYELRSRDSALLGAEALNKPKAEIELGKLQTTCIKIKTTLFINANKWF